MAQSQGQIEWADPKDRICKESLARDLKIYAGNDTSRWIFKKDTVESGDPIEVAELLKIGRSVHVEGKLDISELTSNTEYEVCFDIKMRSDSYGFDIHPVTFSLTNANGATKAIQMKMKQFYGLGWIEIPVGRFNTGDANYGEIRFKLYEDGGHQKKGLVVRGVIIRAV